MEFLYFFFFHYVAISSDIEKKFLNIRESVTLMLSNEHKTFISIRRVSTSLCDKFNYSDVECAGISLDHDKVGAVDFFSYVHSKFKFNVF